MMLKPLFLLLSLMKLLFILYKLNYHEKGDRMHKCRQRQTRQNIVAAVVVIALKVDLNKINQICNGSLNSSTKQARHERGNAVKEMLHLVTAGLL